MSEQIGLTSLELEQLHQNCSEIADLADGLKEIITELVENTANTKSVMVSRAVLDKIVALAEVYT